MDVSIDIGFIGGGVMGSALAGAAVKSLAPERVMVADVDAGRVADVGRRLGCLVTTDTAQVVERARFVVFCIKSHLLRDELTRLAPIFSRAAARGRERVVVTVIPAVTAETYRAVLGVADLPVIRMVPNTACAVGRGLTLLMEDSSYTSEQVETLRDILKESGTFDSLPPAQFLAGAVAASTLPAFIGMFAAAAEDSGVLIGLPRDRARRYALECLVSTGQMLLESGRPCESVKEDVCSPAGAAIRGVRALEAAGLRSAVTEAVWATFERYCAMGDIQK